VGEIGKPQLAVYAAAAIAIALIGARYLRESRPAGATAGKPVPVRVSGGGSGGAAGGSSGGPVVMEVAGEVRRPGVYRLRAGQRVEDAVRLAGGLTGKADLAGVNLAAKAEDGRQVVVPARGAAGAATAGGGSAAGGGATAGVSGTAAGAGGAPVNLNTATAEQLDGLDGVGPATAQKILAYRTEHGGFRSVAELDQVPGIGPAKMAALKSRVTV
jgi:competence protein ComEA